MSDAAYGVLMLIGLALIITIGVGLTQSVMEGRGIIKRQARARETINISKPIFEKLLADYSAKGCIIFIHAQGLPRIDFEEPCYIMANDRELIFRSVQNSDVLIKIDMNRVNWFDGFTKKQAQALGIKIVDIKDAPPDIPNSAAYLIINYRKGNGENEYIAFSVDLPTDAQERRFNTYALEFGGSIIQYISKRVPKAPADFKRTPDTGYTANNEEIIKL